MDRYLIVRLSSLGDVVHTIPALAALRRHRPGAEIAWAVSGKGREILELVRGLDEIIPVGRPGWRRRLRGRDRVVLDFQGLLKSALIARLSGARRRLGFGPANLREPLARLFYTDRLETVPETDHVICKNLRLLRLLGIEDETIEFPLALPEPVRESFRAKARRAGIDPPAGLVVANIGAAWSTKRWYPERWTALLKALAGRGRRAAVLWGTDEERCRAEKIGGEAGVPVLPFLTIGEAFALLAEAALLISGDTFALQAACALGTPVVGLFGPTSPERNGPFRETDRTVHHRLPCSSCYKRTCPTEDCLRAVTVEEVLALSEDVLPRHG